jgi:small subunit ribosomal protein S16
MLIIRFSRVGKRNQPAFKIIVTEKGRPPRSGKFVEQVGFYNPLTKEKVLNQERIKHWIKMGAKPSPTVFNLLLKEKILEGEKIPVHKKPKEKKKETKVASEKEESKEEKPTEGKEEPVIEKKEVKEEIPQEEEKPAGTPEQKGDKKEITEETEETPSLKETMF